MTGEAAYFLLKRLYQVPAMNKRSILIAVITGAIFLTVTGLCIVPVLFGQSHHIATVDFGTHYSVRLWNEYPNLKNWDPDISSPSIYYEITRFGKIIVPKTWLGLDFNYKYDIRYAYDASKTLICVYDTHLWDEGLFVIFDMRSGESWPRLRDDEVSYDPQVTQKWISRYRLLILENPDLPQHFLASDQEIIVDEKD